ncbi:hypothetical protein K488DRAFT_43095, partial [Vararia minispora EC-137]
QVPNVKLRPVQKTSSRRRTPPPSVTPASSPPLTEDPSSSYVDPCPRPLRGVVLCATGVDKSTVFGKATEMGASTNVDFTDRITHLIAERPGGAKYLCAVERKIPILKPSWILDNFEIWLRGDFFDFEESIEQHRLPIFDRVILCLSGYEDIPTRTEINRKVTRNGGIYVKALERPVRVTHLICSGSEETDKMKYARKFNERREANIKIVWEEWFNDCLEYGAGQFDETPYLIEKPRPEPRAMTQLPPLPPSIQRVIQPIPINPDPLPEPEPFFAEEEEIAQARRVPAVTVRVWETLLKHRGFVQQGNKLVRVDRAEGVKPSQRTAAPESLPPGKGQSALATFSRTKSFAPSRPETELPKQPFRRATSLMPVRNTPTPELAPVPESAPSQIQACAKPGIFSGIRFRARGEARSTSVRGAVEGCGGIWIEGADEEHEADIILVRLVSGSALYRAETDEAECTKYRTECWMEACLARERVCAVDEHISFMPLGIEVPIPSASDIVLSPSGLDIAEDTWVKRLTRALGILHAPTFSRASTHLLCPAGSGQKFKKAHDWGIPVISMEWLKQMTTTGTVPSVFDYLVLYPAGQGVQAKGKQKAVRGVNPSQNGQPPTSSQIFLRCELLSNSPCACSGCPIRCRTTSSNGYGYRHRTHCRPRTIWPADASVQRIGGRSGRRFAPSPDANA